jgi:TPR repeat protein
MSKRPFSQISLDEKTEKDQDQEQEQEQQEQKQKHKRQKKNDEIKSLDDSSSSTEKYKLAEAYYEEIKYVQAVELYTQLANKGHGLSQNKLAICYYYGYGVDKDFVQAYNWFLKSATQGYASAQINVSTCYKDGEGVEKNLEKYVYWLLKAFDQNHSEAQQRFGVIYEFGSCGFELNTTRAFELYSISALQNNIEAQCCLGHCYEYGTGVQKDLNQAFEWYMKSALQGNARAQYKLSVCYRDGVSVQKDSNQFFTWCEKSAKQSFVHAQYLLANHYDDLSDEKNAAYWHHEAAKQNWVESQLTLGNRYLNGLKGLTKDEPMAVYWYTQAAYKGYARAQSNLGHCFEYGKGVEKDEKQAFSWYEKAAMQNNALAQYNLGNCYEKGIGVDQDVRKAIEWYTKSVESGYYHCIDNICHYYINLSNRYLSPDDNKNAFEWLKKLLTIQNDPLWISDKANKVVHALCERESTFVLSVWDVIKPRASKIQRTKFEQKFNIYLIDQLNQDRIQLLKSNQVGFFFMCRALVSLYTCDDVSNLVLTYLDE